MIGTLLVVIWNGRVPTVIFHSFSAQPGSHWNVPVVKKNHGKHCLMHVPQNGTVVFVERGRPPSLNYPGVAELFTWMMTMYMTRTAQA